MVEGAKFCAHCGKEALAAAEPSPVAEDAAPVVEAPVAAVPAEETPAVTASAPAASKKKGKGAVIAIIAAVLVVALAVGGFFGYRYMTDLQTYEKACVLMEAGNLEEALALFEKLNVKDSADKVLQLQQLLGTNPTEAPTNPDLAPTEPPTVAPTEPPVELIIKQAELKYELTDADVEEYNRLLEECERICKESSDWEEVDAITNELTDQYEYLGDQYTIAMILYYCNLRDTAASELYLECTDIVTQADNDYKEMLRRLYLSNAPCKDQLFEDWTEQDFAQLMAYSEEVMRLQQRNSELEVAYQDLQGTANFGKDMVPIYVEMVCNNNRLAQIYGYDNYYAFAYDLVYERDYDPDQIKGMRSLVQTHWNGTLADAKGDFYGKLNKLSESDYTRLTNFLYERYTKAQVESYFRTLPENMRNVMMSMFNGDFILKDTAKGVMEGAFTTSVSGDRCICYFGPGYSGAMTIIHEAGHYYGANYEYLKDIPMDLAETQSQGNEWLFMKQLESQMGKSMYNTLVDYKLYSDMSAVVIGLLIDEFEERVYTHADPASLTGEMLDAIMEDVCKPYGGIKYINTAATEILNYWRLVVVEQPVYYISYSVSAIASMDLFNIAQEDYDAAVELYRRLNEEIDLDKGFLGNLQDVGIATPFEEDVYIFLAQHFN